MKKILAFLLVAVSSPCMASCENSVRVGLPVMDFEHHHVVDPGRFAPFPMFLAGSTINGLTVVQPELRSRVHTGECGHQVEVDFGYTRTAIYISSKYSENSCEYRTIERHEKQHARFHMEGRIRFANVLKQRIEQMLIQTRASEVRASLNDVVSDTIHDYQMYVGANNMSIDTQQSYTELQSKCRNW